MKNDWRADYDAEVRERDRLMGEVKAAGLLDQYTRLEVENEGWDGEPSMQASGLQRVLRGPCDRFRAAYENPEYCAVDGYHRIDHSHVAGGIGHPPERTHA